MRTHAAGSTSDGDGMTSNASKPCFKVLELHVTHACNLACESCSHYSNHAHSGEVSVDDADRWMSRWSDRVVITDFRLMGGEPTIHPELVAFVALVRRHWPETSLRIITNGFFLNRHPDLPRAIAEAGNSEIIISIHHDSPRYHDRLRPALELAEEWRRKYHIAISLRDSFTVWTRRYHGFGATMSPFEDGYPRQSWEICPARYAKQLFEGKIWKCAPLAYLPMQHAKYGLSEKWRPYLAYKPLDPLCSDDELDRFIALEDETFCSMCSAERRPLKISSPLRGMKQS